LASAGSGRFGGLDRQCRQHYLVDFAGLAPDLERDQVLAVERVPSLPIEGEAGLPGVSETRQQIADIGTLDARLGLADRFAIEQHGDRDGRRATNGPALKNE